MTIKSLLVMALSVLSLLFLSPRATGGITDTSELERLSRAMAEQKAPVWQDAFRVSAVRERVTHGDAPPAGAEPAVVRQSEELELICRSSGPWRRTAQETLTLSDNRVLHREQSAANDGRLFRTFLHDPDNPFNDDGPYQGQVQPAAGYQRSALHLLQDTLAAPRRELNVLAEALGTGRARVLGAETVNGQNCLKVAVPTTQETTTEESTYWLNVDKRYAVQRIESRDALQRLLCRYEAGEIRALGGIWLPASAQWRLYRCEDPQAKESILVSETTTKLVELDLKFAPSPDTFEIKYPPGTQIQDMITGEHYVVGEKGDMDEQILLEGLEQARASPAERTEANQEGNRPSSERIIEEQEKEASNPSGPGDGAKDGASSGANGARPPAPQRTGAFRCLAAVCAAAGIVVLLCLTRRT